MINRDDLHRLLDAIPESAEEEARIFLIALARHQNPNERSEGYLDSIAADPKRREQFGAVLEQAWLDSEQDNGRSGRDVFAELRARAAQTPQGE